VPVLGKARLTKPVRRAEAALSSAAKQSVHMDTARRVHTVMAVSPGWREDEKDHLSAHQGETSLVLTMRGATSSLNAYDRLEGNCLAAMRDQALAMLPHLPYDPGTVYGVPPDEKSELVAWHQAALWTPYLHSEGTPFPMSPTTSLLA
jgi:hypothetical protein